jgi:hypothetical protein
MAELRALLPASPRLPRCVSRRRLRIANHTFLAATARLLAPLVLAGLALGLGAAFLRPSPATAAPAADGVVTDCTDAGFAPVLSAVQASGGGAITFSCSGTITFAVTKTITSAVTIDGGGMITLSGGNALRLFIVNPGARLTLRNLTISNGYSNLDGGAIHNAGHLVIEDSILRENNTTTSGSGGAILNIGVLTVTNASFINNTGGNAGAIYPRFASSRTTIRQSFFWNNRATITLTTGWGGAMLLWDGAPVTISETQFLSNSARHGGALYNLGDLSLFDTQLISNVAALGSGGLFTTNPVTVTGGLWQQNQCGASCFGGAIYSAAPLTLIGADFVSNTAPFAGGVYAAGALSVSGGLFRGNHCQNPNCSGGALLADAGLTVVDTDFISNTAGSGGGAAMVVGPAALSGGLFERNRCTGSPCQGGGLYALNTLAVTNTRFVSNTALAGSGAGLSTAGGLALSGAHFVGNQAAFYGCGAYALGSAQVAGGLFEANACTSDTSAGGGLRVNGALALSGTHFISNTAGSAGGAYAGGPASLDGGRFERNACAEPDCRGGGLRAQSALTITATHFVTNSAGLYGGGLYAQDSALISGAEFRGNGCRHATCRGGGLFAASLLDVQRTSFLANSAVTGGGLHHGANTGLIANNLFAANTASSGQGSALRLASGSGTLLLHNTIASATLSSGSAVFVAAISGNVQAVNNLIANSLTGYERESGSLAENYTLFSGVSLPHTGGTPLGANSFSGAAGFANPALGDFRLGLASAAIDQGSDAGLSLDYFGNPRPLGSGFDIGFHELDPVRRLFLPLIRR